MHRETTTHGPCSIVNHHHRNNNHRLSESDSHDISANNPETTKKTTTTTINSVTQIVQTKSKPNIMAINIESSNNSEISNTMWIRVQRPSASAAGSNPSQSRLGIAHCNTTTTSSSARKMPSQLLATTTTGRRWVRRKYGVFLIIIIDTKCIIA